MLLLKIFLLIQSIKTECPFKETLYNKSVMITNFNNWSLTNSFYCSKSLKLIFILIYVVFLRVWHLLKSILSHNVTLNHSFHICELWLVSVSPNLWDIGCNYSLFNKSLPVHIMEERMISDRIGIICCWTNSCLRISIQKLNSFLNF
jgi:hypothetical protein